MHGKFDATMVVSDPLEVCGPIKYEGDEAYDLTADSIEILAVAVFQPSPDGKMVFGFTVEPLTFTSPTPGWEHHVPAHVGTWGPGLALAMAVVRVNITGLPTRWTFELWNEIITLF